MRVLLTLTNVKNDKTNIVFHELKKWTFHNLCSSILITLVVRVE